MLTIVHTAPPAPTFVPLSSNNSTFWMMRLSACHAIGRTSPLSHTRPFSFRYHARFHKLAYDHVQAKNCLECGHNNFCITETIKYNAHIDAKTKLLFTDCMIMSNIEKVFCINRGTEQNRAGIWRSVYTDGLTSTEQTGATRRNECMVAPVPFSFPNRYAEIL